MKNYSVRISIFTLTSLSIFYFASCSKNSDYHPVSYKQYFPLQKGKYFIYRLDSIVPVSFGSSFETHSYIIKDSVVEEKYDLNNRLSFKLYRYQQNGNDWISINTFIITPTANSLEYIEDNNRFIKLKDPISSNTIWKGNAYLTSSPYVTFNDFFTSWQFVYNDIGSPKKINDIPYPNTVTVVQYDSIENRDFYEKGYNTYTKSYEVYADSIGLVYKDVLNWEYQPSYTVSGCKHVKPDIVNGGYDTIAVDCSRIPCDSIMREPNNKIIGCDTTLNSYYYNGYGIKQTLLNHN